MTFLKVGLKTNDGAAIYKAIDVMNTKYQDFKNYSLNIH
jgi:hypothetical protein